MDDSFVVGAVKHDVPDERIVWKTLEVPVLVDVDADQRAVLVAELGGDVLAGNAGVDSALA